MSTYTYQTTYEGQEGTVRAGFCSRTATFFAQLFIGDDEGVLKREKMTLQTDFDVLVALDSWGLAVPRKFEDALASDVLQWQFGDGDLKAFCRKIEHFGYVKPMSKRHLATQSV